jgi:hypothetical protein
VFEVEELVEPVRAVVGVENNGASDHCRQSIADGGGGHLRRRLAPQIDAQRRGPRPIAATAAAPFAALAARALSYSTPHAIVVPCSHTRPHRLLRETLHICCFLVLFLFHPCTPCQVFVPATGSLTASFPAYYLCNCSFELLDYVRNIMQIKDARCQLSRAIVSRISLLRGSSFQYMLLVQISAILICSQHFNTL